MIAKIPVYAGIFFILSWFIFFAEDTSQIKDINMIIHPKYCPDPEGAQLRSPGGIIGDLCI